MEKTRICIYHDDLDGITSAAIVRKVYPDCEFKAMNYGNPVDFNEFIGNHLILVDFSFPIIIMDKIEEARFNREIKSFCWIDHHKTAKKENPEIWGSKFTDGIRSTEKAACELTWDYFFPNEKIPECIRLIGDGDIWKFEYGDRTKEFCEFANIVMNDPTKIDFQVIEPRVERWMTYGRVLLDAKKYRIKKSFDEGQDAIFEGHICRVVNTNHDISALGEYIYKDNDYPVAFIWSERNGQIIVSLRSKKGSVDVGELAKKYGGGGHTPAAGIQLDNFEQLGKILKRND